MFKFKDLKIQDVSKPAVESVQKVNVKDIAIIGMAGYFPEVDTLTEFWENLCAGKDHITDLSVERKKDLDRYFKLKGDTKFEPRYTKSGFLNRVDFFDYSFFGLSPMEANAMDPNQRIFLEVVWKAIEDAGYGGNKLAGSETGVYVGFSGNAGGLYQTYIQDIDSNSQSVAGGLNAMIGSRISYLLDLKGPSMLLDSSCSSSLLAVHTACRAIRNGDCTTAICGGVNLNLLPLENNQKIGIESSTYQVRAFAEGADGTVSGEGSAAILLKPLHAAISDGDHIYAVIKGSAANQDGKSNGITSPNVLAQEQVLIKAWQDANIEPETLSYIETHGTGTKIGDPIEVEALTRAMHKYTDKIQFCAIGSLKSNIGHLDGAAGIAGIVKSALALKHKQIPPTLHFECPNRLIDFINSPYYVNIELTSWDEVRGVRRCGVSAFGMSGTNCHIVLEGYDNSEEIKESAPLNHSHVLAISAPNEEVLIHIVNSYIDFLSLNPDVDLKRLCYTINTGRGQYSQRLLLVFDNYEDLMRKMEALTRNFPQTAGYEDQAIYFADAQMKSRVSLTSSNLSANTIKIVNSYLSGEEVCWDDIYDLSVNKISLPTYPFQKTRCWLEIEQHVSESTSNRLIGREYFSPTEEIVASVWMEVLGYKEINISANFYDLGGDSILALKIVNKLREKLQINIEISMLLIHQTITGFSEYLETRLRNNHTSIIPNSNTDEEYMPLSFAQRGIYFAQQRAGAQTSYNMPGSLDIFGPIDLEQLESSLHKVVNLHKELHATFHIINQMPVQKFEEHKLRIEHFHSSKNQLESLYRQFVRPFNISKDFLIRVGIVHCTETHHCIFFDVHHLISDGVSMNILIEDFVRLYTGQEVKQADYSYSDYVNWQNSLEVHSSLKEQELFWMNHLSGKLPVLNMPSDYTRPNRKGFDGNDRRIEIDPSLTKQIRELARREGVTQHTLLLSVYAVLLYKHSGQEDIIIGSPTSGRHRAEWERIVGMFVNTLALRLKPHGNVTFRGFLTKVRDIMHHALDNQDYPFEKVADKVDMNHDLSRSPVFDTMFIMQNNKSDTLKIDELSFVTNSFANKFSKYDFKMEVYDSPETLSIILDYRTDLYKETTVQTWLNHYVYLLQHISSNMDTKIDNLTLTEQENSKQLINDFNDDLSVY